MPALSTTILSDGTAEPDPTARLTFSTYQTMIRHIDTEDKTFSVGRFDLIIIDEAHRSIFGKYRVILDYFDALVVGLTATPRDQIDRSTYDMLQVEGGCPTYCYEYDTAVSDGFLVDYHGFIRESQIMNQGIRYSQLTAEEKEEMEAIWDYEQARIDPSQPSQARDILSNEMYNYIFNTDTVDRMLQDLMEHGLKVQSGERIGKTIIFALNSATARLIVERFTKLYPHLGADFCVQIDYSVRYGQDLIAHFSDRDREPQIAVSVDMLDTGIDVPDVLNLVFFKRVRSRIKFLQMIGRGTRLSPGVFGPGQDKTCFNIYDWGGNFHYFEKNPKEVAQAVVTTLTERLFAVRTDIAYALQEPKYQEDKFARSLHDRLKEMLQADVRALSDDFITVRTRWETVTKYRNPAVWTSLAPTDVWALKRDIAPLVVGTSDNEAIKKFDLLALYTELGLLDASFTTTSYEQQIITIAHCLVRRTSIPAIAGKIGLLREVQTQEFWAAKSLPTLEHMREELRELMVYLEREELRIFTVDIHDTVLDDGQAGPIVTTMSYRQSVLDYLTEHADWPVLQKIKNLERLTQADMRELEHILWEELGTEADYKSYLQQEGLQLNSSAAMLIRKLAGVDRTKAISLFTEYIHVNMLNAEQMEFLKSILDYVCQNGDMERKDLIDNQTIRTSMLRIFPDGVKEVGDFIQRIHEAIEVVA
jgi:type I restriction enzyme R subunit